MIKTQEFINRCDVLLNRESRRKNIFKKYLRSYLLSEDFDALITLYGVYLNKEIMVRICEYRISHKVEKLPQYLNSQKGIELCNEVKEWQKCQEGELLDLVNQIITMIQEFYHEQQKAMPDGMMECFIYIGHALVYSAMMNDESFERDWDVISTMFALAYEEHIKIQMIKDEFIDNYKAANLFIRTYKIYLPYYYVAAWDLWKIGIDRKDERYEYNRNRLKKIVSELPDFYRELLSGSLFYPTSKSPIIETGIGKKEERVSIIITRDMGVPFYRYLPAFVRTKPNFKECRNGLKNEFFHPLQMLEIPCTYLFTCLDIELYLNNLYKEIEMDKMRKKILNYESHNLEYANYKDNKGDKACKKVSKIIDNNNKIDLTEDEKKEIIARLENEASKTAELVCKFESEKGKQQKDVIKKMEDAGYAQKTYYNIKSLFSSQSQKSVPNKDTLIALACALELTIEQTKKLLFSSGYIFSPAIKRDVIIEYFIEKGIHSIVRINCFLDELDLKAIEGKKIKF